MKNDKICIIGGGGHVGFPLGLFLASKNFKIYLYEKNLEVCNKINKGIAPYYEFGAEKLIKKYKKNYTAGYSEKFIKDAKIIIVCIGTPVDNQLKPDLRSFLNFFRLTQDIM